MSTVKLLWCQSNEIILVNGSANALSLVMDPINEVVLCLHLGSPEAKSEIRI